MRTVVASIASLAFLFVTAVSACNADDGIGRLHRIDIKAEHPEAYHPIVGDLVQCYLEFPVVPEQIVDNLQVTIEGNSVSLVTVASTSRPGIVGSGQVSAFLTPRQAGTSRVIITPAIPGQDESKPFEMTFVVDTERRERPSSTRKSASSERMKKREKATSPKPTKKREKASSSPRRLTSERLLGEIRMTGFNFAPRGWAFCEGQLLSIAQNQSLFSLLGTTYGGDGRTTFALPDLRGRLPVHSGAGPGLRKVIQGQKFGGNEVAPADNGKEATTRAHLGMRYAIALQGLYPTRGDEPQTDGIAAGEIRMFAGTFAPSGWALCDGQELSAEKNKALFDAIGTTYGGDETNFAVPDLRGRVPVHIGTGPGLETVKRGERGGGEKAVVAAGSNKAVATAACLGVRYIIALNEARGGAPFIGEVRIVAGKSTPRGWSSCDGQQQSINQNDALYALFGTMYGGNGRTTFGLPPLRGRTPTHAGRAPGLPEIRQGTKGGGANVAIAADSDKGVITQPFLGVRYIVAEVGIFPSRN